MQQNKKRIEAKEKKERRKLLNAITPRERRTEGSRCNKKEKYELCKAPGFKKRRRKPEHFKGEL